MSAPVSRNTTSNVYGQPNVLGGSLELPVFKERILTDCSKLFLQEKQKRER
jgi:hypothetical protein